MNDKRRRATTLPGCEALEGRRLMAGNVTAVIKAGTLTIRGDAADNHILVMEYGHGKNIKTTITNTDGKVNGAKSFTFQSRLVKKDIIVNLAQGGNDLISMGGLGSAVVVRNIQITTGKGNDSVALTNVTMKGGVAVNTGDGNDTVQLHEVGIPTRADVNTGAGDDLVIVHDSSFRGPVSVLLGDGTDGLALSDIVLGTTITADGGGNDDTIDTHNIDPMISITYTGFLHDRHH